MCVCVCVCVSVFVCDAHQMSGMCVCVCVLFIYKCCVNILMQQKCLSYVVRPGKGGLPPHFTFITVRVCVCLCVCVCVCVCLLAASCRYMEFLHMLRHLSASYNMFLCV